MASTRAHQEFLTVRQLARFTQYDPQTIYRKVWSNQIPGIVRFGRTILFERVVVLPWARRARAVRAAARAF